MKKIKILSSPRSGTNFLRLNLSRLLPEESFAVLKTPNDRIEKTLDIFQIVVLRDPLESMISSYAHGEFFNPKGPAVENAFRYMNERMTDLLNDCIDNLDYVNIYMFEDIDELPVRIARELIDDVPNNFPTKTPEESVKFLPTVTNTEFYSYLLENLPDPDLLESSYSSYYKLLSLINKNA